MALPRWPQLLQRVCHEKGLVLDSLGQCLAPRWSRSMATEVAVSPTPFPEHIPSIPSTAPVLTTVYSFPAMEPLRFEHHSPFHLRLPLRRDLLHRAVIYEAAKTRTGTASTKWRSEIHGSKRKIRPQKGTGKARLGDKTSPMLRGGGVAFGPKPRDFSTELPRKIYDQAWRTALSYRYQKGELIITEDDVDLPFPKTRLIKHIFEQNHWGRPHGRSLIVTKSHRPNLHEALEEAGEDGRVLEEKEVDVKDLLELGRVIIERSALNKILLDHQSDLVPMASRLTSTVS